MTGQWIVLKTKEIPLFHSCYRKSFSLDESPAKASVSIAACTLYKCYINGALVMTGPARSPKSYRFFDHFEITDSLIKGNNLIAVELMYVGAQGEYDHGDPGFCLDMEIQLPGNTISLSSDGSWRCRNWEAYDQTAPLFHRGYPCEMVNLSKIDLNWIQPNYDDHEWDTLDKAGLSNLPPPLKPRPINLPTLRTVFPRKVIDSGALIPPDDSSKIPAKYYDSYFLDYSAFQPGAGAARDAGCLLTDNKREAVLNFCGRGIPYLVLDLGSTVCGVGEINATIPRDVRLEFMFLEWLNPEDGTPRQKTDRTSGESFSGFILTGNGSEIVFQSFHPCSCRYLCVIAKGLKPKQEVRIRRVAIRELCSIPLESAAGEVTCSDPLLNRIVDAAKNTLRVCTPDFFVDCSSWERAIYLLDSYWTMVAASIFYGNSSVNETMLDMNLEGRGRIPEWPHMFPGAMCMRKASNYITFAHNLTYILQVLQHSRYTGQPVPDHLREALSLMADDLSRYIGPEGLLESPKQADNWCDWSRVVIGKLPNPPGVHIATNAFYYKAMNELFLYTGDPRYGRYAESARNGLRRLANPFTGTPEWVHQPRTERLVPDLFIRVDGKLVPHSTPEAWNFGPTVTANRSETTSTYLLWSGALDDDHAERLWQVLREWRINSIQRRDNARIYSVPRCDLFALWARLSFARTRGDGQVLYRDLREALEIMVQDGDSLWEVLSRDSRSNAHGFNSYAGALIFEGLTGIRPGPSGGYQHCIIDPLIDESLGWARGHLETRHGTIGVAWHKDADNFVMSLGLPRDVTAEVYLPAQAVALLFQGRHELKGTGVYPIKVSSLFNVSRKAGLTITSL